MEGFEGLFERIGTKTVTNSDKNKSAFVLNDAQKKVLYAAGFEPGDGGSNAVEITLDVLNSPDGRKLAVSYYNSLRTGTGRPPETRMGREVAHWMEVGDVINLANIGPAVFIWKDGLPSTPLNEIAGVVASRTDPKILLEKGRKAEGRPARQTKVISDFHRNPSVVAGALVRADGYCEMPSCSRDLFNRENGSTYLEVHHILPLAEGGDDTMINAAALCPACHRELHYGEHRIRMRIALRDAIQSKET